MLGRWQALFGSTAQMDVIAGDQHVSIRRRDVDRSVLDALGISRAHSIECPDIVQQFCENTVFARSCVDHHEKTRRQILRQIFHHSFQDLNTPGGAANRNHVPLGHTSMQAPRPSGDSPLMNK